MRTLHLFQSLALLYSSLAIAADQNSQTALTSTLTTTITRTIIVAGSTETQTMTSAETIAPTTAAPSISSMLSSSSLASPSFTPSSAPSSTSSLPPTSSSPSSFASPSSIPYVLPSWSANANNVSSSLSGSSNSTGIYPTGSGSTGTFASSIFTPMPSGLSGLRTQSLATTGTTTSRLNQATLKPGTYLGAAAGSLRHGSRDYIAGMMIAAGAGIAFVM